MKMRHQCLQPCHGCKEEARISKMKREKTFGDAVPLCSLVLPSHTMTYPQV